MKTIKRLSELFSSGVKIILMTVVLLMLGALPAMAETVEDGCMEEIAGFSLNCTANDVDIAGVAKKPNGDPMIDITDPCEYPGDEVTFTATFEVRLNAKARHDIGIYFATDGDPNLDGAVSGLCNVSSLEYKPDPPWLDLDGTDDPYPGENKPSGVQDVCGDIDNHHNPLYPEITITAVCNDSDGDGFLNLPYCTSWRQPGANDLCEGPLDAYPGSPSKCKCDDGFNVPVPVPPATLLVSKTANPTSVDEPGASVVFSVSVTNTGVDPENDVTLNSLIDDVYGDITQVQGDITATTCSVTQLLEGDDGNPGGIDTYTCTFTANVAGNGGDSETDTVTASGVDSYENAITGDDDATVTITDVLPSIELEKTADPTEVSEPGGVVTFSVLVTNNSVSSDPVTITSLTDDVHGDLNGQGNCSVPQTLAGAGGTYLCSFTATVSGNSGESETDIATASGTDDEGNPVSASDSAVVTVLNVPSNILLVKTAAPTSLDEPGGPATFSITVTNESTVDEVTINSLIDDIHGDLDGQGDCSVPQVLAANGGSYSCSFTAQVSGNAGDSETDTVTASGVDDDGEPVQASDTATINILNVEPTASLTKTATGVVVTYAVEVCNTSAAEALTLSDLADDIYGDITHTQVQGDITATTCSVPQTLAVSGEEGDCYTCSFDAYTETSPTTDTVTGTVNDDDGSAPATPSDSATVSFGDPTE